MQNDTPAFRARRAAAACAAMLGRTARGGGKFLMPAIVFILIGAHAIFGQTTGLQPPQPAPEPAAATPPPPAAASQLPDEPGGKIKESLPVSIFLSPEDQQRIRSAMAAYKKSKEIKATKAENNANDYLNQLVGTEPKKEEPPQPESKIYVYPQFFLSSLVYHGADDWVVLINNIRFSSRMPQVNPELTILEVDKEKVSLEWKPKQINKVLESWAQNKNKDTLVDTVSGVVIFTLHPNQTFSSYAMRVLEGKVQPVVINLKPEDEVGAATGENTKENSSKAEENSDNKPVENITTDDIKNDVGMKGLNKTYKRMGLEK